MIAKGPSYDPHPFVLSAGSVVGRALIDGFGIAPGLSLGFDYRITAAFRIGLRAMAAYASAENELWRYRQAELGASVERGLGRLLRRRRGDHHRPPRRDRRRGARGRSQG